MSPCPNLEQLECFLAEQLSPTEHADLESHVESCLSCQQALAKLLEISCKPTGANGAEADGPRPDFVPRLKEQVPVDGFSGPGWHSSLAVPFPGPPTPRGLLGRLQAYHIVEQLGCGATGFV